VSELQTIRDDNDDFVDAPEMVRRLMDDNRHITAQLRSAIDTVEENRDKATGSLLQDVIDQTERRTWFLFEIAQGLPEKR
jgi:starvation-inducible DNA-binding protein